MPTRPKIEPKHIYTCMNGLKEISDVWPVAKLVHTVFETILGGSRSELEVKTTKTRKLQSLQTESNAVAANTSSHFSIKEEPTSEQPPRPAEQTFSNEALSTPRGHTSDQRSHDSLAAESFEQNELLQMHTTRDDSDRQPRSQRNSESFDMYGPAIEDWHINEAVFDAMWDDTPVAAREPE